MGFCIYFCLYFAYYSESGCRRKNIFLLWEAQFLQTQIPKIAKNQIFIALSADILHKIKNILQKMSNSIDNEE